MARADKSTGSQSGGTVDAAEVARFSALADQWWDPLGKFAVLHKFNPVRLAYIRDALARHFGRDARDLNSLTGLRLLDIGCGGGLLSEPMARLGAQVVGVDASALNVDTARTHAAQQGLAIDYRASRAEDLAEQGEQFDAILNMEVVEHVADVDLFLTSCARMLRPGGLMIVATLNRTLKSYALAIVGAEYVLGWLPRGTHDWNRFIRPDELDAGLRAAGLLPGPARGVIYQPLHDAWQQGSDTDVNYMMSAAKRV